MVWTYLKNMPGRYLWFYLPAHLLANLAFMAYYPFAGHGRSTWLAKWHAIKGLPIALRKRGAIQRGRLVPPSAVTSSMDRKWLSPYLPSLRLRRQRSGPVVGRD
jgi:hypothetical protein